MLCVAGVTAVSAQVRCIDAAREAARLAARGDERGSAQAAHVIGPAGAALQVRVDGDFVVATVTMRPALLPGVTVSAQAVSAVEPTG